MTKQQVQFFVKWLLPLQLNLKQLAKINSNLLSSNIFSNKSIYSSTAQDEISKQITTLAIGQEPLNTFFTFFRSN